MHTRTSVTAFGDTVVVETRPEEDRIQLTINDMVANLDFRQAAAVREGLTVSLREILMPQSMR